MRQMYPGHSRQVLMSTASCHAGAYANRYVVVVDEDIDPTDTDQVLWAMCTRTDVIQDIDVIKRCWSTSLDPMAYAGADGRSFYNNRMLIDACRPYDRIKTFPAIVRTSDAAAKRLRSRWPDLFGADGKARADPVDVVAPE
jgi:4-hydroxy-3-polyprenylbenzoate decarboxylase